MNFQDMWKRAEKEKTIVDITPQWVPFESEGQCIVGRYRGSAEVSSSLGEGTYLQYLFDTDEGLVKFSLGKATDNELSTVMFVGGIYHVTYLGQVKVKGGRRVNQFKVQVISDGEQPLESSPDVPF